MLPGHLDTLLQNLVSNAIKFPTTQSVIEVHVQQTDPEFTLTVVDMAVASMPQQSKDWSSGSTVKE